MARLQQEGAALVCHIDKFTVRTSLLAAMVVMHETRTISCLVGRHRLSALAGVRSHWVTGTLANPAGAPRRRHLAQWDVEQHMREARYLTSCTYW